MPKQSWWRSSCIQTSPQSFSFVHFVWSPNLSIVPETLSYHEEAEGPPLLQWALSHHPPRMEFALPPVRCQGPSLAPSRRKQQADIDGDLYDALVDLVVQTTAIEDLEAQTIALVRDRAISWTRLRSTFQFFIWARLGQRMRRWSRLTSLRSKRPLRTSAVQICGHFCWNLPQPYMQFVTWWTTRACAGVWRDSCRCTSLASFHGPVGSIASCSTSSPDDADEVPLNIIWMHCLQNKMHWSCMLSSLTSSSTRSLVTSPSRRPATTGWTQFDVAGW